MVIRVWGERRLDTPSSVGTLTLEGLFRDHADDVHRMVVRLLGPGAPEADVDDVTQQIFVAVHRALPRFRGDSKITTWLYGIAAKTVLHHRRGQRRYVEMVSRFEEDEAYLRAAPDAEQAVANRLALRRVWAGLARLTPKKRVVLILHDIEGLTTKEISKALDIREGTVKSRLRNARHELLVTLDRTLGRNPK